MLTNNDQRPTRIRDHVLDGLGIIVAGTTVPTGFRLFLADWLLKKAGGFLLFNEHGLQTPMPEEVAKGGIIPRGVSVLCITEDANGRKTHKFTTDCTFWFRRSFSTTEFTPDERSIP